MEAITCFSSMTPPPATGRPLPGEVAHAARAVVRGAVLALSDAAGVDRVRIQWDCDGANLLVDIRDNGAGDLTVETPGLGQLAARVAVLAFGGTIEYFRDTVFNYPTLAEAYKVAALAGLNRL